MKRMLLLLFVTSLLFANCKNLDEKKTPGILLKQSIEKLMQGDIRQYTKTCCIEGNPLTASQDSTQVKVMTAFCERVQKNYKGFADCQLVRETISEDGKSADVRIKLVFGNGTAEETEYEMNLVGKEWKINLKM